VELVREKPADESSSDLLTPKPRENIDTGESSHSATRLRAPGELTEEEERELDELLNDGD
jgi:hypothetical protein